MLSEAVLCPSQSICSPRSFSCPLRGFFVLRWRVSTASIPMSRLSSVPYVSRRAFVHPRCPLSFLIDQLSPRLCTPAYFQMIPSLPLRNLQLRLLTCAEELPGLAVDLDRAAQQLGFIWSVWSPDNPPEDLSGIQVSGIQPRRSRTYWGHTPLLRRTCVLQLEQRLHS